MEGTDLSSGNMTCYADITQMIREHVQGEFNILCPLPLVMQAPGALVLQHLYYSPQ